MQYSNAKTAMSDTYKTGRTLVMVISTDNCPWCTKQKELIQEADPQDFDYVFADYHEADNSQYVRGDSVPQLLICATFHTEIKLLEDDPEPQAERLGHYQHGFRTLEQIRLAIDLHTNGKTE